MRLLTLTLISSLLLSSCGTTVVPENTVSPKKEIPGATVAPESSSYSGQITTDVGVVVSSSGTYRESPK